MRIPEEVERATLNNILLSTPIQSIVLHQRNMRQVVTAPSSAWELVDNYSEDIDEILRLVEPYPAEHAAIVDCIRLPLSVYKVYVARSHQLGAPLALVLATFLPRTKTLHIEDYALHPIIRGLNLAAPLWRQWREFVATTEGWGPRQAITIEVYLQNVKVWNRVMGVADLKYKIHLPLAPHVPVQFMGRDLTASPREISDEWLEVQQREQQRVVDQRIRSKRSLIQSRL